MLFQAIHGVSGQFHSCAQEMLQFLLKSLADKELQDTLFEVLVQLVGNIVSKINSKNSELFWNTLIVELKELFEANTLYDSNVEKHIDFLLQICGIALEYREGRFLHSNKNFVQGFISLNLQKLPQPILLTYCKVAVLLLLSENVKLSQEYASSLTKKITNLNNEDIFLYFVENIHRYSGFEALILPNLLKLCFNNKLSKKFLCLLSKIILQKSPLCGSGINLDLWKKYSIDFGSTLANCGAVTMLEDNIVCDDFQKALMDPVCLIGSLICLPHIATTSVGNAKQKLEQLILLLCENVDLINMEGQQIQLVLFSLQIAVESLIHLADETCLMKIAECLITALLPLATNVEYLLSLKILDLLFTALRNQENIIQMEMLLRLNKVLENNFCSPYHEVSFMLFLS